MKTPLIEWNQMCYSRTVDDLPAFCRSYTGKSFRSLSMKYIRGSFLDVHAGGPLDAPDTIPAGSHQGENVTCNGMPLMRRAPMIYPSEVAR
jgi:hypothetical protein